MNNNLMNEISFWAIVVPFGVILWGTTVFMIGALIVSAIDHFWPKKAD